jgi:hypothetical protein
VAGTRPGLGPGSNRTGQDLGAIVVEFETASAAASAGDGPGTKSAAAGADAAAAPADDGAVSAAGGEGEGRLVAKLVAVSVARSAAPVSLTLSSTADGASGAGGRGGGADWGLMVSEAAGRGARGLRGLRLRRELEARRIEHRRLAAGDDAREALVARVPLYRSESRPAGSEVGYREVRLRLMASSGPAGKAGGSGDVAAAAASWHWDFAAPDPPTPAQPLLFDAAMDAGAGAAGAAEEGGFVAGKRLEGRLGVPGGGSAGRAGPWIGREAVRWDGEGEGAAELQATVEAAAAAEALRALISGICGRPCRRLET